MGGSDKGSGQGFDFETLRAAVHGCIDAKEVLFDAARHFLAPIARHELDSAFRVRVAESDLIQETLVLANAGLPRFQGSTDREFEAWLRTIFVNCMLNHYRSNSVVKRSIWSEKRIQFNGESEPEAADTDEDPSSIAIANEERVILERAISMLPTEYQEVIRLRHQERLTFVAIGKRTGRSADAARKLWYRAFKEVTRVVRQQTESTE